LGWGPDGSPACEVPGFLAEWRTFRANAKWAKRGGALSRCLRQGSAKPDRSQGGEVPMSQHSRTNSPYHARQEERRSRLLAERAHGMRHAPTASEAALWQHLRGRQLGVQFRRQVVVGRFIVDFLVPSVRLVVEVDGGWHSGRDAADARRDAVLQRLGYRVLRLAAELVDREVEVAVAWVRDALAVPRGGLPSGLLLRT